MQIVNRLFAPLSPGTASLHYIADTFDYRKLFALITKKQRIVIAISAMFGVLLVCCGGRLTLIQVNINITICQRGTGKETDVSRIKRNNKGAILSTKIKLPNPYK